MIPFFPNMVVGESAIILLFPGIMHESLTFSRSATLGLNHNFDLSDSISAHHDRLMSVLLG
jgi:hypothetical protein